MGRVSGVDDVVRRTGHRRATSGTVRGEADPAERRASSSPRSEIGRSSAGAWRPGSRRMARCRTVDSTGSPVRSVAHSARRAAAKPPGEVYDWYQRAVSSCWAAGSPAAAVSCCAGPAEAEPQSPSVREALGRALFERGAGTTREAAGTSRRSSRTSPPRTMRRFGLGLALSRMGEFQPAVEHLGPGRGDEAAELVTTRRPCGTSAVLRSIPARLGTPDADRATYDVAPSRSGRRRLHGPSADSSHAAEAWRRPGQRARRLAFVTNNASRTPSAVVAARGRGRSATEKEDVVTSAQAAARLLAERLASGGEGVSGGRQGLRPPPSMPGVAPRLDRGGTACRRGPGLRPAPSYGLHGRGCPGGAARRAVRGLEQRLEHPPVRPAPPGQRGPVRGHRCVHRGRSDRHRQAGVAAAPREHPADGRGSVRWSWATGSTPTSRAPTRRGRQPAGVHRSHRPADGRRRPARAPAHLSWPRTSAGLLVDHPDPRGRRGYHICEGWTAPGTGGQLKLTGEGDPWDGLRVLPPPPGRAPPRPGAWRSSLGPAGPLVRCLEQLTEPKEVADAGFDLEFAGGPGLGGAQSRRRPGPAGRRWRRSSLTWAALGIRAGREGVEARPMDARLEGQVQIGYPAADGTFDGVLWPIRPGRPAQPGTRCCPARRGTAPRSP